MRKYTDEDGNVINLDKLCRTGAETPVKRFEREAMKECRCSSRTHEATWIVAAFDYNPKTKKCDIPIIEFACDHAKSWIEENCAEQGVPCKSTRLDGCDPRIAEEITKLSYTDVILSQCLKSFETHNEAIARALVEHIKAYDKLMNDFTKCHMTCQKPLVLKVETPVKP